MKRLLFLTLFFAISSILSFAKDNSPSPKINTDNSVTFTYTNPDAEEVYVKGSFVPRKNIVGPLGKSGKYEMIKEGDTWTFTTEPLTSELYTYNLHI